MKKVVLDITHILSVLEHADRKVDDSFYNMFVSYNILYFLHMNGYSISKSELDIAKLYFSLTTSTYNIGVLLRDYFYKVYKDIEGILEEYKSNNIPLDVNIVGNNLILQEGVRTYA